MLIPGKTAATQIRHRITILFSFATTLIINRGYITLPRHPYNDTLSYPRHRRLCKKYLFIIYLRYLNHTCASAETKSIWLRMSVNSRQTERERERERVPPRPGYPDAFLPSAQGEERSDLETARLDTDLLHIHSRSGNPDLPIIRRLKHSSSRIPLPPRARYPFIRQVTVINIQRKYIQPLPHPHTVFSRPHYLPGERNGGKKDEKSARCNCHLWWRR